jgi:hypothetical protein
MIDVLLVLIIVLVVITPFPSHHRSGRNRPYRHGDWRRRVVAQPTTQRLGPPAEATGADFSPALSA